MRITESQFAEVAKCQRQAAGKVRGKYGAIKTEVDGIAFASKLEARRYTALKLLERAGAIKDLRLQVVYELAPSVVINGRKRPALRYLSDFNYVEEGAQVVEDCKGVRTEGYRIKRHLMMAIHGIAIRETGK